MTNITEYMNDGANYQAQAVLCCLRWRTIEDSWNKERSKYDAEVKVARWENCREQGYVAMLRTANYSKQLNIAWFEHRNSDSICAIAWEQNTTNSPTIDTAKFGDKVYKDKWDVSKMVSPDCFAEIAAWIWEQFENFYKLNSKPVDTGMEMEGA